MVSYPDTAPHDRQTLALRPVSRAPSVASTSRAPLVSSHRRQSRQIRSHAGGASYQPQNEFPVFTHTGDVEIIITSNPNSRRASANAISPYGGATAPRREDRYLLHRLILSQCSGFFDEETTDPNSGTQQVARTIPSGGALARLPPGAAAPDETGRRKRWRFEMDWGENGDEMPVLVQKEASPVSFSGEHAPLPPPVHNKPQAPSTGFFRTMAHFSSLNVAPPAHTYDPQDDIFRDYANLFRIFYNYPPALDSVNIAQAYVECKTLLQLADMYDALEVIGPRVDHHLLRFQGRLFKQIAKYPPSYLKLGFLARSRVIYSEALVHVVGQWPVGANQLRGQIPQAVLEVIEDKADEMEELKTKIETKLFKLTLTTTRGERVTPSNGFIDWMALSLFRQWLAENTSRPPAPILKSTNRALPSSRTGSRNGLAVGNTASSTALATTASAVGQPPAEPPPFNTGRVFRLIGTGGDAYLGRDELKRFLKLNAEFYTRENMRKFERRMEEIKNLAADMVKPLMRNFLELDMRDLGHGLPYLTCTKVEEQDYVWDE